MGHAIGPTEAEAIIEIVRHAARAEILPRFRRLAPADIRAKSAPDDLVTEADLASEDRISAGLAAAFPGACIIGEEGVAADPALLGSLDGADVAFVIDPIDGTWNFAAGLATFGVIVAAVEAGRTTMGLLYDPVMDDWVLARSGGGAWMGRPGEAPRQLLLDGRATPGGPRGLGSAFNYPVPMRARLAEDLAALPRVEGLRCSCHEYRLLAQGRVDFVLAGELKCWDHAAGVLAVEEAGGSVGLIDGRVYAPTLTEGRLVAAASPDILGDLRSRFAWIAETDAASEAAVQSPDPHR